MRRKGGEVKGGSKEVREKESGSEQVREKESGSKQERSSQGRESKRESGRVQVGCKREQVKVGGRVKVCSGVV